LPSGWSLALLDGNGEAIAHRAPPGLDADVDAAGRFVVKSEVSPWSVMLEIPRPIYRAPLFEAATKLAIVILCATLAGILGGILASRRLGRAVASLAGTSAIGTPSPNISEIAAVRRMLDESAERRSRAESAQYESEKRFRGTFEQAAVGIALVAPDGRWLRANRRLCDIVGYGHDELLTKTFQDITHPDDLDADLSRVRQMLAGEIETYSMEKRYVRKGGDIVWINLTVALVRHTDGSPEYFISVIEDIQARKQAEAARAESEANLAEAQRIGHIGSWYWDVETDANVVSDELRRIYGREVIPPFAQQIGTMYPHEAWQRLNAAVQEAVRTGMGYDLELPALRGDGTAIWINTRCDPVRAAGGEVVGLRGTVQDITERIRVSRELLELNVRLEHRVEARTAELTAANAELDSFSYSVSHDLRAPLRGIDGWSLALLEDCGSRLDEAGRQYLGLVRSETQRMGHLIDDLLQLARVTRSELRRETVDLSALARTVADRLVKACPDRKIEFLIAPDMVARADSRLLEVVITNLLDNACKFTGTRPVARIEFGTASKPDPQTGAPRKVYVVRDNGVGFDMTYATRLFTPFQRLHAASKFPGTGIGLATVQRIVRRHGGQVWADALENEGANFYFTLAEGT
jgi:PAS domain S-box-containing protein